MEQGAKNTFDAVVIGSGFGGAVTACRLTQAQVRTLVLERGRRYTGRDFPLSQSSLNSTQDGIDWTVLTERSRLLWSRDHGLLEISDLGQAVSVQAAAYGGGSMVYANVHVRPPYDVFAKWPKPYRDSGLAPYFDLAAYMLNVSPVSGRGRPVAKAQRMEEAARAVGQQTVALPLAINFGTKAQRENEFSAPGVCDFRGQCVVGCSRRAKNTLDHNYLRLARNNNVSVWTCSEVTLIERAADGFCVTYRDLLVPGPPKCVYARYVFLCAGALNSTRLLQRSAHGDGDGRLKLRLSDLGRNFYLNGDSVSAVFDCDVVQEPDRGPTITRGIYQRNGRDFLLIEDGGLPQDLAALIGLFRSPLWLRHNRFLEYDEASSQYTRRQSNPCVEWNLRDRFGELDFLKILPPWLAQALERDRDDLLAYLSANSERASSAVFDDLANVIALRLQEQLTGQVGEGNGEQLAPLAQLLQQLDINDLRNFGGLDQFDLVRGFLRLAAQLTWGSEARVAALVAHNAAKMIPTNLKDLVGLLEKMGVWLADYRYPDGRSALLLTMGTGAVAGRLVYRREDESLRAEFPAEIGGTAAHELALRSIARHWRGELRTDPMQRLSGRRVTVHGQGGCGMGVVTNTDGQVRGCPNLYVMDAAAFPGQVGVNPSATVLAVAEYKMERFWQRLRREGGHQLPATLPRKDEKVRRWIAAAGGPTVLDPLNAPAPVRTEAPTTVTATQGIKPLGLRFNDHMEGTFQGDQRATLSLTVEIDDLAAFLSRQRRYVAGDVNEPASVQLAGKLTMPSWSARVDGFLRMFVRGNDLTKRLEYELHYVRAKQSYTLRGRKIVVESSKVLDIWKALTTLDFEVYSNGTVVGTGVLRMTLNDFLERQVRELDVTGTRDSAARAWALAAFARYFLGEVVSFPGLARDLLASWLPNALKQE